MKKISFILCALLITVGVSLAQQKAPKAKFDTVVHDFGKLEEKIGTATTKFIFKNIGDAPLILQRVQASCGCTTPSYPKKPILPGETGEIEVTYSTTGRPGVFDKKVTIFSNVPNEVYVLTIKGEVIRQR